MIDRGINLWELTDGAVEAFNLAVGNIAQATKGEWMRLAQARLKTTREMYIQGLRQSESFSARVTDGVSSYEIQLVGRMPNNIEFGMPAFDMKSVRPGWLGGGKAKTTKEGTKYVVIPFRHSTSSDVRMAYTGKAAAVSGPNLKTQLKATVKQYGLDRMMRAGAGGAIVEGPTAKVPAKAPVHPYLRGLTRVQKAASGSTKAGPRGSSKLMTWRVMSEDSPADSWQHPGLPAANILREVEAFADKQMDSIVDFIVGAR